MLSRSSTVSSTSSSSGRPPALKYPRPESPHSPINDDDEYETAPAEESDDDMPASPSRALSMLDDDEEDDGITPAGLPPQHKTHRHSKSAIRLFSKDLTASLQEPVTPNEREDTPPHHPPPQVSTSPKGFMASVFGSNNNNSNANSSSSNHNGVNPPTTPIRPSQQSTPSTYTLYNAKSSPPPPLNRIDSAGHIASPTTAEKSASGPFPQSRSPMASSASPPANTPAFTLSGSYFQRRDSEKPKALLDAKGRPPPPPGPPPSKLHLLLKTSTSATMDGANMTAAQVFSAAGGTDNVSLDKDSRGSLINMAPMMMPNKHGRMTSFDMRPMQSAYANARSSLISSVSPPTPNAHGPAVFNQLPPNSPHSNHNHLNNGNANHNLPPLNIPSSPGGSASNSARDLNNNNSRDSINNTDRKIKCSVEKCTAFAARGEFCLRHVWKADLPDMEPVNQMAYNVAKEIVMTERTYTEGLKAAVRAFYVRLQSMIEFQRPIVPEDDVNVIFNNIEDLYNLSMHLSSDLDELYGEKMVTQHIGTTLLHYAPSFRIYQQYLEGYDDAIKRLTQKRKDNDALDFFVTLNEHCEGHKLQSLLIMPVQRLPRYLLLLAQLHKYMSKDDVGYADVAAAHSKIGRIAEAINLSLHQKEAQNKVLMIQNQFEKDSRYMELVSPNRYLVKDGILKKRFSKTSKHLTKATYYHFFLFNDVMVYAAFNQKAFTKEVTFKMKHILRLDEMDVLALPGPKSKNKDIEITTGGKSLVVVCRSPEERNEWLRTLKMTIEKCKESQANVKVLHFDGSEGTIKSSKLKAMMGLSSPGR